MPPLTLRSATPGDAERVLEFWNHAAEEAARPKDTHDGILRLLDRDPGALILALAEDEIVGSVILGWDGWRCHIYRLAVHPMNRRAGIASALLTVAEERARASGAVRIDAIVFDEGEAAHCLWTSAGYVRQARWSRWIKDLEK